MVNCFMNCVLVIEKNCNVSWYSQKYEAAQLFSTSILLLLLFEKQISILE